MAIVERDWKLYEVTEYEIDTSKYQEEYDWNIMTINWLQNDIDDIEWTIEYLPEEVAILVVEKIEELQDMIELLVFRNNDLNQWL